MINKSTHKTSKNVLIFSNEIWSLCVWALVGHACQDMACHRAWTSYLLCRSKVFPEGGIVHMTMATPLIVSHLCC